MILDAALVLSDQQAITTTAASTNYVDTLAAGDPGQPLYLYVQVDTSFTATGSATLTIDLETAAANTFSGATILYSSGAVGKATLVATAGSEYELKIPIPRGALRYLRLNYTVASGPMTAGKLTAAIVKDVDLAA